MQTEQSQEVMQALKRAAIYIRRSTDERLQGDSLNQQRTAIQAYADANGFSIVREFCDSASGSKRIEARRAFQAMLAEIMTGANGYGHILLYDVSRFSRAVDADESAHLEYLIRQKGVAIHYVNEPFNTTNDVANSILKTISRTMAGQFSLKQGQLTIRGATARTKEGFFSGGRAPYAYQRAICTPSGEIVRVLKPGEKKLDKGQRIKLVPSQNPAEVRTLKWIFNQYANAGWSINRIVQTLNEQAIPSYTGGLWAKPSIYPLLKNPVFIGRLCYGRRSKSHSITKAKPTQSTDIAHEPLIDEATFNRAQDLLKGWKVGVTRKGTRSDYLLSGLLRCACGHKYYGKKQRAYTSRPGHYYQCSGFSMKRVCMGQLIRRDEIEARIIRIIEDDLANPENVAQMVGQVMAHMRKQASPGEILQGLQQRKQELQRKCANLTRAIEEDYSDGLAKTLKNRLRELAVVEGQIAQCKSARARQPDRDEVKATVTATLTNLSATLKGGDPATTKAVIQRMIEKIEIDPAKRRVEVRVYTDKALEEIPMLNWKHYETTTDAATCRNNGAEDRS